MPVMNTMNDIILSLLGILLLGVVGYVAAQMIAGATAAAGALGQGLGQALAGLGNGVGAIASAVGSGIGAAISGIGSGIGRAASGIGRGIGAARPRGRRAGRRAGAGLLAAGALGLRGLRRAGRMARQGASAGWGVAKVQAANVRWAVGAAGSGYDTPPIVDGIPLHVGADSSVLAQELAAAGIHVEEREGWLLIGAGDMPTVGEFLGRIGFEVELPEPEAAQRVIGELFEGGQWVPIEEDNDYQTS